MMSASRALRVLGAYLRGQPGLLIDDAIAALGVVTREIDRMGRDAFAEGYEQGYAAAQSELVFETEGSPDGCAVVPPPAPPKPLRAYRLGEEVDVVLDPYPPRRARVVGIGKGDPVLYARLYYPGDARGPSGPRVVVDDPVTLRGRSS